MTITENFITNATTETLRTRLREAETNVQRIKQELERRTNLQIEQLQAQIQRILSEPTTQTSSVAAETIADEEYTQSTRDLSNNITVLVEDEDTESVDQFVDDQRIRVRRISTGNNRSITVIHPTNPNEGVISAAQSLRDRYLSNRRIDYGEDTGLLDNANRRIISGTIVELLSQSTPGSPFRNQSHAIVVGTSHYGRRVLLGLLSDRNETTHRDPQNILGPIENVD